MKPTGRAIGTRLETAIIYSIEHYGDGSAVTSDEHLMAREILRLRGSHCAGCDRPSLCNVIASRTAPCGENRGKSVETVTTYDASTLLGMEMAAAVREIRD